MNENLTPEQRGEQIGQRARAMEAQERAYENSPAGHESDRKKHVGLIVAVVAFAVLLVGAGVAYAVLAPTAEKDRVDETPAAIEDNAPAADNAEDSSSAGGSNAGGTSPADKATPAPNFTMTDAEGNTLTLDSLKGKPILLNFWASWCGPCRSEMPEFEEAYHEYGDQVQFVMVNMTGMSGETQQDAQALIDKAGYTFPVYFDQNNSAAKAYGVTSIPQTYLIDSNGNIIDAAVGAIDGQSLNHALSVLVSK